MDDGLGILCPPYNWAPIDYFSHKHLVRHATVAYNGKEGPPDHLAQPISNGLGGLGQA